VKLANACTAAVAIMDYQLISVKHEAADAPEEYDNDDSFSGANLGGADADVSRGRGSSNPAAGAGRKKAKLKEPSADLGIMSENQICVVCGDYASGFHYSALTCEACKSFFKRTVQDKHEYTCSGNFDCSVSKSMRKSCQYCRFQKCLVNGMLPQDVRMDRTRGGRKKCKRTSREQFDQLVEQIAAAGVPANPATAGPAASSCADVPPPQQQAAQNVSNGDIGAERRLRHQCNNSAGSEKFLASMNPLDSFIREAVANDAMMRPLTVGHWPGGPDGAAAFSAAIRDWFIRGLNSVIVWSNSLKCLDALLLQDRISLLAKNWFVILLMDTLARSIPYNGFVQFASNFSIGPNEAVACQVPQDFYSTLCGMLQSFDHMQLDRGEISMLKLLALLDHSIIDDIGIISRTEGLRGATLRALYRISSTKLDISEHSEQCDLYVSKLLLRQGFTVNLKMGLESWSSLEPPSFKHCTEVITRGLGIHAASPTERSSPEDDCTSSDSCPDQFRSRLYFKTMRPGSMTMQSAAPAPAANPMPPPPPPPPPLQYQQQQQMPHQNPRILQQACAEERSQPPAPKR
ncbi:hypothetical protein BOX15_Mlig000027g7, partial [Macrostomum lignano]